MSPQTIESRVRRLEGRVMRLEQLPERMDRLESQFVQLRTEMRDEFSAVRGEIRQGDERVVTTLREEIRAGDERVVATLREEIRAGDQETRRFMLILHEKVIADIALLGEAGGKTSGRPGKKPKA